MRHAILVAVLLCSACGAATGPAGQSSSTNVNPVSGNAGGSGAGGAGAGSGSSGGGASGGAAGGSSR